MLTGPMPKPNVKRPLRRAILFVALIGAVATPAIALVQMTVETPVLGMTGWRTKPVTMTVETPVLGMTGWRTKPVTLTVETLVLGMTGWGAGPKPPPERTHPFRVVTANLTLFHENQPLPAKLVADCPAQIGHKAFFTTEGKLPGTITYHFEWSSGERSTNYTKADSGDRADPLYDPPSRFHAFPYPLPAKGQRAGDLNRMAANGSDSDGLTDQLAAPGGSANEHKGSVRVVVSNPYGAAVASGWARYDLVCKFKPGLVQNPRTVCIGGSISNGRCLCPSTTRMIRTAANAWRCVRPDPASGP